MPSREFYEPLPGLNVSSITRTTFQDSTIERLQAEMREAVIARDTAQAENGSLRAENESVKEEVFAYRCWVGQGCPRRRFRPL